ncbi:MAG: hypothetical protein ACYSWU_05285 [Planctomycetota bacterium]
MDWGEHWQNASATPPIRNVYEARTATEITVAVIESQRPGGPVKFHLKNRHNPLTMLSSFWHNSCWHIPRPAAPDSLWEGLGIPAPEMRL